ncbi:MAG: DUF697 domain-containing protein [Saprospiraceae bacterium]|nr:DUF697 domain-containing protein [Saprospiraceae bacterium]
MQETEEKVVDANQVIRSHMMWSMGAGLIPVPVADIFAVSAIQLDMVRQLCKIYEVDYKETELKAVVSSLAGSIVAKAGARVLKFIPGVGAMIGGMTLAILSGGSTYALGEVFKKHFETGGTFLDFDPARLRKMYDEMFEKGKKYAREIRVKEVQEAEELIQTESSITEIEKEQSSNASEDVVGKLKDLGRLKEEGLLTDEEFAKLKKRLIED